MSTKGDTRTPRSHEDRPHSSPARWGLAFFLLFAPRAWYALHESAAIHPDVLGQALEPAARSVYGYGRVAWEFEEGVRSWLWPGLFGSWWWLLSFVGLAGPGVGSELALQGAGLLCAGIDSLAWCVVVFLVAPVLARQLGFDTRQSSLVQAAATLVGATHPIFTLPGSQPIIGVLASLLLATAGAVALRRHYTDAESSGAGSLWTSIGGAALTACALLRPQLAPAVLVLGLLALRVSRERTSLLVGGGVALLLLGLLDWWTWGLPWSSTYRYLMFSFTRSDEVFGRMPPDRYLRHGWDAGLLLLPLLTALAFGMGRRAWALGALLLSIALPHQLVGQKQLHFLHAMGPWLALGAALGLARLHRAAHSRLGHRLAGASLVAALFALFALSAEAAASERYWRSTWLYNMGAQVNPKQAHRGGMEAVARSRALSRAYRRIATWSEAPPRVVQSVLPSVGSPGVALYAHPIEVVSLMEGAPASPPGPKDLWLSWGALPPQALPDGFQLAFEEGRLAAYGARDAAWFPGS